MNFIQSGFIKLFNHFENQGDMWTQSGSRMVSAHVEFDEHFINNPTVFLTITLMDAASDQHLRYELLAENVAEGGFDAVFKTWMDSRFARIWVRWVAIGERSTPDMWTNI